MIAVVVLLSLSVLLFARALYIVRADKKLRDKLANMTREERSIYNNQKLAELAAIKAYTDREKTARTIWLTHSTYEEVYPGDVDYDRASPSQITEPNTPKKSIGQRSIAQYPPN